MRILFVEDEPAARAGLLAILTKVFEHSVDIAENADEAVNQMRKHAYDLVLLDIMIPAGEVLPDVPDRYRYGGAELLVRLRNGRLGDLKTAPHVDVVAITAVSDMHVNETLTNAGCRHVFSKPIDPDDAVAQMGHLLYNRG